MTILSHRGYWKEYAQRNQRIAFARSFDLGFGTETDLRDSMGKIVISHDMPLGNEMLFEEFLQMVDGRNLPLALNIKSDGQSEAVKELLGKYNHTNYFTFDMSIPDMIHHFKHGLRVFTGFSDILQMPVMLDAAAGVWLDCFHSDWYGPETIDGLIARGKYVCIVSAELHNRSVEKQWEIIKQSDNLDSDSIMLCTDNPEKAKDYFS